MGLNNARKGLFIPQMGLIYSPEGVYSPIAAHEAYFASWALAKWPGVDRVCAETRQDKTRQLYLTRVAQSAARLVSLGALGSIKLTYTHLFPRKASIDNLQLQSIFQNLSLGRSETPQCLCCGKLRKRWPFKKSITKLKKGKDHSPS